jgi:hypothetical protein
MCSGIDVEAGGRTGRSLGLQRKGGVVRCLGLGIERGHKLRHGGAVTEPVTTSNGVVTHTLSIGVELQGLSLSSPLLKRSRNAEGVGEQRRNQNTMNDTTPAMGSIEVSNL